MHPHEFEHQTIKSKLNNPETRSEGLTLLYDLMKPVMLSYANRILDDRQKAEDAVQDIFVQFLALESYGHINHLDRWLFRSLRNIIINNKKKEEVITFHRQRIMQLCQTAECLEGNIDYKMDLDAVSKCLEGFQSSCFNLVHKQGFEVAVVKDILNIHESYVRKNLKNAYQNIMFKLFPHRYKLKSIGKTG